MKSFPLSLVAAIGLASLVGCARSQPAASSADEPSPPAKPEAERGAPLSEAQCKAAGGAVVGDIGDGAIHRPGYRCAKSGEPPLGHITSPAGQPMAVEGAVCCR